MIPNKTEHEGAKGTKPFLAAMGVQKKNIEKKERNTHTASQKRRLGLDRTKWDRLYIGFGGYSGGRPMQKHGAKLFCNLQ